MGYIEITYKLTGNIKLRCNMIANRTTVQQRPNDIDAIIFFHILIRFYFLLVILIIGFLAWQLFFKLIGNAVCTVMLSSEPKFTLFYLTVEALQQTGI